MVGRKNEWLSPEGNGTSSCLTGHWTGARASRRALYCSSATGQQWRVMPPMRDNQESMELVIFSINYLLLSLPSEPFFDCQ